MQREDEAGDGVMEENNLTMTGRGGVHGRERLCIDLGVKNKAEEEKVLWLDQNQHRHGNR